MSVDEALSPELLLAAYRRGVFPMAAGRHSPQIRWYAPDPRAVIDLEAFSLGRHTRRLLRAHPFVVQINQAFRATVEGCAEPRRTEPDTWISEQIVDVYTELHRRGHAHSVEAWLGGRLVGGLYLVQVGAAVMGESMFSREPNASTVCLLALIDRLKTRGFTLLDTQFSSDHLRRFACVDIERQDYEARLAAALAVSPVPNFAGSPPPLTLTSDRGPQRISTESQLIARARTSRREARVAADSSRRTRSVGADTSRRLAPTPATASGKGQDPSDDLHDRTAYRYDLPPELIAQTPAASRDAARMLVVVQDASPPPGPLSTGRTDGTDGTGPIEHAAFRDLPAMLTPRDLIVVNDTVVRAVRLTARRETGARVEVLVLRLAGERAEVLLRANRKIPPGDRLLVLPARASPDASPAGVLEVGGMLTPDGVRELRVPGGWLTPKKLDALGAPPLPPYIKRAGHLATGTGSEIDTSAAAQAAADRERYQTVYAREDDTHFSAAAPTAGLHFTPGVMAEIEARTAGVVSLTLDVGLGTFRPVRTDDIREHTMHAETFRVPAATLARIRAHRAAGGRVIPVGTTSARVLETLTHRGHLPPRAGVTADQLRAHDIAADIGHAPHGGLEGATAIFCHPPHPAVAIDGLLTNFHLPESTLLMFIAAILGRDRALAIYAEAVRRRYRFFSYGDAMLIRPSDE